MTLALPWMIVYIIHCAFVRRFKGCTTGEPLSWRKVSLIFLAKVKNATNLPDFRGIALLSVLAKWYMAGIMLMICAHT